MPLKWWASHQIAIKRRNEQPHHRPSYHIKMCIDFRLIVLRVVAACTQMAQYCRFDENESGQSLHLSWNVCPSLRADDTLHTKWLFFSLFSLSFIVACDLVDDNYYLVAIFTSLMLKMNKQCAKIFGKFDARRERGRKRPQCRLDFSFNGVWRMCQRRTHHVPSELHDVRTKAM